MASEDVDMTAAPEEISLDLHPEDQGAVLQQVVGAGGEDRATLFHRKGRGFEHAPAKHYDIPWTSTGVPKKSIEGWIIVVSGVHPEATEEELLERCLEYGAVRNLHLNLDRRTGYVKGYALVEYNTYDEAKLALTELHGSEFLGQALAADFCFVESA